MMQKPKKPAGIFLDWDGTLVDSFQFLLKAHNHVREILGRPPMPEGEFKRYFGMPRELLYRELYGKNGMDAKKHFEEFVTKHHMTYLNPLPGADDLVRTIVKLGIPSGVISNKKGVFVRNEIDHFGWTPLFSAIVGAGEAPQDKPAGDPLLLGISLAGVIAQPADIWYVGDSETDAICAENTGASLILIDHGDNLEGWARRFKPLLVVKNCGELTGLLLQWFQN